MRPKLLIVDDDQMSLESTRDLLQFKYDVLVAGPEEPVKQAMELCEQHPDLRGALVDLKMPSAHGEGSIEVGFALIKQLAARRDFLVVVHSAFADPENWARASELGAREFFSRTQEPQQILKRLEELLESHPPRPADPPREDPALKPSPLRSFDVKCYQENRDQISADELLQHTGKWVAFNRDGSRIVDSSDDLDRLYRMLANAGKGPADVVFGYIPDEDIVLGGAEFL
jgi:response regulator RpfG family c-di-GMP phosphodiesterase